VSLRRFWIEFEGQLGDGLPAGVLVGCGVTAFNYDDAVNLVRERVFEGDQLPRIKKCVEDVDVSALDQGHVLPNMSSPTERGIWFPLGYEA